MFFFFFPSDLVRANLSVYLVWTTIEDVRV